MIGAFVQLNLDSPKADSHPLGYVVQENGCWEWVGARNAHGYGVWYRRGKLTRAHRELYESAFGPIPTRMVIDHLCRNPACVRPAHMEVVSQRENVMRGNAPAKLKALQASRTPEERRAAARKGGLIGGPKNTRQQLSERGRLGALARWGKR